MVLPHLGWWRRRAFAAVLVCLAAARLSAGDAEKDVRPPETRQAAKGPGGHSTSVLSPFRGLVLVGASLGERREFAEMLLAFVDGGGMGPHTAWFHPSQSRYGWKWLAARHQIDPGSEITRAKFQGAPEWFDRLDRDGNGVLNASDFDWTETSPSVRKDGPLQQWAQALDVNSNGRISKKEWDEFFARASGTKGYLTSEDLRAALVPPRPSSVGGPSPFVLLRGLFNGELGSSREGPGLHQPAPDFLLRTHDGAREVRLSDFRGNKPVVLVFGSFT